MLNQTKVSGGIFNSYFISYNYIYYKAYIRDEDETIKENYYKYIKMKYEKLH